jgi:hypothetical protein
MQRNALEYQARGWFLHVKINVRREIAHAAYAAGHRRIPIAANAAYAKMRR